MEIEWKLMPKIKSPFSKIICVEDSKIFMKYIHHSTSSFRLYHFICLLVLKNDKIRCYRIYSSITEKYNSHCSEAKLIMNGRIQFEKSQ